MRRILISATVMGLLFGITSCEQEESNELQINQVPNSVQQSFNEQHSTVEDVDWEKHENLFEANFEKGSLEYSILYDEQGKELISEMEEETDFEDLPISVKAAFQESYDEEDVEETSIKQTEEGMFYELDLEIDEVEIELIYNESGTLLSCEVDEKEDE